MRNPFAGLTPRGVRRLYTGFAAVVVALGFFNFLNVMVWNVIGNDQCAWRPVPNKREMLITDVVPGGVSDQAGIRDGDYLLKLNGVEYHTPAEAQRVINLTPAGEYVKYVVLRGGREIETRVRILKAFNLVYFAQFLLGLGFLLVAFIVVMTKPQGETQRRFGRYGILTMFFFSFSTNVVDPAIDPRWRMALIGASLLISHLLAPPEFIRFFLHFPVRRRWRDNRLVLWGMYALNLLFIIVFILQAPYKVPGGLIQLLLIVQYAFFFGGLAILIHSYFRLVELSRRTQLRPILIASVVGALSFIYILVLGTAQPFVIFLQPVLLIPALLIVFVPIAFGYSIFRYRLMDIDLLVKRSLIYGVVTAGIAAIYLVMVYGVGTLLASLFRAEDSRLLTIVAIIMIAFAFDPLKRRTQEWVDRVFYQERYNYQQALLEFSRELPRQIKREQILRSIVQRISSTMHISRIAVMIVGETHDGACVAEGIDETDCRFADGPEGLVSLLRTSREAQSFALLSVEAEAIQLDAGDKEQLRRAGIVLVVPILLQDKLLGFIAAGEKLSGKIYSKEDVDLLSTVASQAAIALDNARLHETEVEQQKAAEQLQIARSIQMSLLPKKSPEIAGLDISGVSIPAMDVGGDYYDFIALGPKKVLVVVADVAGKGMSAALYMSKIQGMIQLAAHMYRSPREMLVHVNRRIFDGIERRSFITMVLALFDMEKKEVRICRAGHNEAIIRTNGKMEYLRGGGIGLGLEEGDIFEEEIEEIRKPLRKNGLFVFYSDGISEAMNGRKEEFGEAKIRSLVRAKMHAGAQSILKSVIGAVDRFRGKAEQHDDMTLVVVKSGVK